MPKNVRLNAVHVRRSLLISIALLVILFIIFAGTYVGKIYRRNLRVDDVHVPALPQLALTDRLLIVSPHPDDETLGAGGLIARATQLGIPVRVVFMTNGDGSLSTRLLQDVRLLEQVFKGKIPKRTENIYRSLAPIRQAEATRALAALGVRAHDVTFLGYPDGGTRKMWEVNWDLAHPYKSPYTKTSYSPYENSWTQRAPYSGEGLTRDIEQILREFKPTLALTTSSYDTHPDHWAANAYLRAALAQLRLNPKFANWASRVRFYTFLIHHGPWPVPHGYHPDDELTPPAALAQRNNLWFKHELSSALLRTKTAALGAYRSQLATTPQFLRSFLRQNELFDAVPEITMQEGRWTSLIHDPVQDLLVPSVVRAGDITTIEAKPEGKVLLLRIKLGGRSWKGLRYIITLHSVTATGISREQIILRTGQDKAKTKTEETEKDEIIVTVPAALAHAVLEKNAILLISASSVFRNRLLDITPTRLVKTE